MLKIKGEKISKIKDAVADGLTMSGLGDTYTEMTSIHDDNYVFPITNNEITVHVTEGVKEVWYVKIIEKNSKAYNGNNEVVSLEINSRLQTAIIIQKQLDKLIKINEASQRVDIMVDIETLGNKVDSTIFQISAIAFDINTKETIKTFNMLADISKNKEMNVTGDTLKWWLDTDRDLLQRLLSEGTLSSDDIVRSFYNWIVGLQNDFGEKCVYLWGNGILFDNKMIQYQLEKQDIKYPIFYRNDRDVRTILDLASMKLKKSEKEVRKMFEDDTLVKHDAIDDVKFQISLYLG